ncbi:hypothetical protein TNCV_3404191 [Trichonephila clavipes]|nr:hypothetical protein TNCV_3404191 [Trichonephila clavipes]
MLIVLDNSHPDTANMVKQFLAKKKRVVQIEHSPYSPDLYHPGFFLLLLFKLALKGKIFDDIHDIQRNGTRFLNSIPQKRFLQTFQDMHSTSQRCVFYTDSDWAPSDLNFSTLLITPRRSSSCDV